MQWGQRKRFGQILVWMMWGGLFFLNLPASAQFIPARLTITGIDTTSFPEIRLFTQLRGNNPGVLLDFPDEASLRLYENGEEKELLSTLSVDAGVRMVFVIESGDGLLNTGMRVDQVYRRSSDIIKTYTSGTAWMQKGVDTAMVLVQNGETVDVVVPFTTEPVQVLQGIEAYVVPGEPALSVYESGVQTEKTLERALEELETDAGAGVQQTEIILFTPGFYSHLEQVIQKAVSSDTRIHVVLVRESPSVYWSEFSMKLAEETGGCFIELSGNENPAALLDSIRMQGKQVMVVYHSTDIQPEHMVHVNLEYEGFQLQSEMGYQVELYPPEVVIHPPNLSQGSLYPDTSQEPESEVEVLEITADVLFPDGFSSRESTAVLFVDYLQMARVEVVGGQAVFYLEPDDFPGKIPATIDIQIVVEDELGLIGTGELYSVDMEMKKTGDSSLHGWILSLSFLTIAGIAGAAGYVAYRRSKEDLRNHVQNPEEEQGYERFTRSQTAEEVRAYLIPLDGFTVHQRTPFELYGTTSLGRSRKHADILLHLDEEGSPISRLHVTILHEGDRFSVRDENSSNGTFLNEEPLIASQIVQLHDGDILDLGTIERGGVRMMFKVALEEQPGGEDGDRLWETKPGYEQPHLDW